MIYGTSKINEAVQRGDISYEVLPECTGYHKKRVKGVHIDLQVGHHVWYKRPYQGVFNLNTDDPQSLYVYHNALQSVPGIPSGTILLLPGVGVLLHSVQAVGSLVPSITTKVDGRSTLARFFVEAHQSAGHGDPGFVGVWVFEVLNNTDTIYSLHVGSYIASIVFSDVYGQVDMYPQTGRYQSQTIKDWNPTMMLPKRNNLS